MNNGLKAAVLSGLVIPGLGQLVLRQYIRAAVYILSELIILALLTIKLVRLGLRIITDVQNAQAVDLSAVSAAVRQSLDPVFFLLVGLALAGWIISVVDAWLTGNRQEAPSARSSLP